MADRRMDAGVYEDLVSSAIEQRLILAKDTPITPGSLLGVLPPDELRHRRHRVGDHAVVR